MYFLDKSVKMTDLLQSLDWIKRTAIIGSTHVAVLCFLV